MEILKSYRYRLEPTEEQKVLLNKHFGSTRFIYNHFLNEKNNQYKETKKSDNYIHVIRTAKGITSYAYKPQRRKELIENWPTKKYNIIYADPPWEVMAGSKQSRKEEDSQKSLPLKYPTMALSEIAGLPVKSIKEPNSVLFLWTINKYLEQSYSVARSWGFTPSTMLVWDKTPKGLGLGGTFTLANEYLLFCRSGSLPATHRVKGNHWFFPRENHSKKPDFFREMIVDTFGDLPKVELFARQKTEGWDVWGNEV